MSYENVPEWIKKVPDQYKAQEMCNKAASMDSLLLRFVPDRFKTQKMCIKAAEVDLSFLQLVLDHFKTEEMCNKAAYNFPWMLGDVPDLLKTREMCNEAVDWHLCLLEHVPDLFITRQQIEIWHDDDYLHSNTFIITWYHGYQKRKSQKAKIKEELRPVSWHPHLVMERCMSEDEKRLWK